MLYGLEPGLQRRFEHHGAYEKFQELKLIFHENALVERYLSKWEFLDADVMNVWLAQYGDYLIV